MATIHTRGEECAAGLSPAMCVMCALPWHVPVMSAMAVRMAGCERPAVGAGDWFKSGLKTGDRVEGSERELRGVSGGGGAVWGSVTVLGTGH